MKKRQNINHEQPQATICIAREEFACNHVIFTSVRGNAPGKSVCRRKHSWEPQYQEMLVVMAVLAVKARENYVSY
jgi:hypothetical protein